MKPDHEKNKTRLPYFPDYSMHLNKTHMLLVTSSVTSISCQGDTVALFTFLLTKLIAFSLKRNVFLHVHL